MLRKKMTRFFLVAVLVLCTSAGVSLAGMISLTNGNFDETVAALAADNSYTPAPYCPNGWEDGGGLNQLYGLQNVSDVDGQSFYEGGAPSESYVLYMTLDRSAIRQVTAETLQPNTTYTFSAMVGNRLELDLASWRMQIITLDGNDNTSDYVQLFDSESINPAAGYWAAETLTWTTGDTVTNGGTGNGFGDRLALVLLVDEAPPVGANGWQVFFDSVSFSSEVNAVPEPSTLMMLLSAFGVMLLLKRKAR